MTGLIRAIRAWLFAMNRLIAFIGKKNPVTHSRLTAVANGKLMLISDPCLPTDTFNFISKAILSDSNQCESSGWGNDRTCLECLWWFPRFSDTSGWLSFYIDSFRAYAMQCCCCCHFQSRGQKTLRQEKVKTNILFCHWWQDILPPKCPVNTRISLLIPK